MSSVAHRLMQVRDYAADSAAGAPLIPDDALGRLNEPMLHQFRILSVADQKHLLAVYRRLVELGAEDDTITAGLIHDVGKACGRCHISLTDRVLHVILSRVAARPYAAFGQRLTAPAWCRGLHRLAGHPARGARAAEQADYNARVIELIRYHERGGNLHDRELALLRRVDGSTGAR